MDMINSVYEEVGKLCMFSIMCLLLSYLVLLPFWIVAKVISILML